MMSVVSNYKKDRVVKKSRYLGTRIILQIQEGNLQTYVI